MEQDSFSEMRRDAIELGGKRRGLENFLSGVLTGVLTQGFVRIMDYGSSHLIDADGKMIKPIHVNSKVWGPIIAVVSNACIVGSVAEETTESRMSVAIPFCSGYVLGTALSYTDKIYHAAQGFLENI
ncbi:MAG: hypothetical protein KJ600_03830 [Nanoarchaeota archaeon]|nr:hypothetical protein [Nanoarchaeota archaeon]MBU1103657.1 hypothetical protein [Nanoarchaeota archaeon]